MTKRMFDLKTETFVKVRMTARALRTIAKNPKKYEEQIHKLAKKALKKEAK